MKIREYYNVWMGYNILIENFGTEVKYIILKFQNAYSKNQKY